MKISMSGETDNTRAASPLAFRDVTKALGAFTLGPVNVEFLPGVTALLGANGAGKTTLLRLAVGILAPDHGQVMVGGQTHRLVTGTVGYLPQDFSVPRNVRVCDYLRFIAWCRSSGRRRLGEADVCRALTRVDLVSKGDAKLGTLSGGMVRRVGIAQALIGDPGAIVLDEPTVGLDPLQRRELRDLLEELASETVVLVSTHLSEDVAAVASRVTVLACGAMAFDGSVEGLVSQGGGSGRSGDAVERGFLALLGGEDGGRS